MKKVIAIILGSTAGFAVLGMIILVAACMLLDFFGINATDGYVENNMDYATEYRRVLNDNLVNSINGYVSLERILYFYTAIDDISFDEIYKDNLDKELKQMSPISEVCMLEKYKHLDICKTEELEESGQIDDLQAKPFVSPVNISKVSITSFFMEERKINNSFSVHMAWDLGAPAETPVYSVCDGTVEALSFPYENNVMNKNDMSGGNKITISCDVDDLVYTVLYAHLYPFSNRVSKGDKICAGQQIAAIGQTGYSTGNHLHYQVSLNGAFVDGFSLIDFATKNNIPGDKFPSKPF